MRDKSNPNRFIVAPYGKIEDKNHLEPTDNSTTYKIDLTKLPVATKTPPLPSASKINFDDGSHSSKSTAGDDFISELEMAKPTNHELAKMNTLSRSQEPMLSKLALKKQPEKANQILPWMEQKAVPSASKSQDKAAVPISPPSLVGEAWSSESKLNTMTRKSNQADRKEKKIVTISEEEFRVDRKRKRSHFFLGILQIISALVEFGIGIAAAIVMKDFDDNSYSFFEGLWGPIPTLLGGLLGIKYGLKSSKEYWAAMYAVFTWLAIIFSAVLWFMSFGLIFLNQDEMQRIMVGTMVAAICSTLLNIFACYRTNNCCCRIELKHKLHRLPTYHIIASREIHDQPKPRAS